jgi:hypothetical protein
MIEFLKESTFTVNEVISKAWGVTKRNYFSIATLCFLMFITSMASTILSGLFSQIDFFLSLFMLGVFVLLYFTLNLTLFRYIFHLLDDEKKEVLIVETIPTKLQIITFLIASISFMGIVVVIMFVTAFIPFVIFYGLLKLRVLAVDQDGFNLVSNIFMAIGFVTAFIAFLRLSFFPFFIIDKNTYKLRFTEISFSKTPGSFMGRVFTVIGLLFNQALLSIKFSLALTKGNFTKLLMLLVVLGAFGYLYGYLRGDSVMIPGKIYLVLVVILFVSFIIVPLTAVALTVAYRKMISEYKGEDQPDIIHNIV